MIKNNGSIHIEGDFELFDEQGGKYDLNGRTKIKLCRCGFSNDKPFCDSAHKLHGWDSVVTAHQLPPPKVVS
ncbi:MAG TPA: CDGSH iron-sulfur domain-containing protein [Bacteroidota bacterium]|nr:CDGSH iron-sulfur domain-containing protein [Bacteroidota bacterium]